MTKKSLKDLEYDLDHSLDRKNYLVLSRREPLLIDTIRFLDTIREHINLFNEAGFSAGEIFSIIETGAAGGVLGTDKVADAIREFNAPSP